MKQPIQYLPIDKIKSHWFKDILKEWQPDEDYICFVRSYIQKQKYLPPIVVVKEGDLYCIVNGHHRFYAHLKEGSKKIKSLIIQGTFEESEPLRKAEVMLKEFDQKTNYIYQFSGYLDRWAADAEEYRFINKFGPTYKFKLYKFLKKLFRK